MNPNPGENPQPEPEPEPQHPQPEPEPQEQNPTRELQSLLLKMKSSAASGESNLVKNIASLFHLLSTRVGEIADANERHHEASKAVHLEMRATISLFQEMLGQFDDKVNRLEQAEAALIHIAERLDREA